MRLESAKYLHDVSVACDRLARFCAGRSFADYGKDEMLRAAVERQFTVIGEALSRLSKVDPDVAAGIPDCARIVAFRNILIHGYAFVDDRIVWGVVESDLVPLRAAVRRLLAG